MFTKRFERRLYLAVTVIAGSGLFGFSFFLYAMWPTNIVKGYQPDQPIQFSHRLHAGDMKMNCVYCHTQVETGAHATVPPLSTCMNCHSLVHPVDAKGRPSPEINKLKEHWEAKKPLEWNKVNDLADFVYFNHSRHIAAGVTCNECHGPVETMDKIRRANSLKMGWCLSCHMQPAQGENAPGPVVHVADIHETTHELPKIMPIRTKAPIHCNACHR